eukprot:TRINITY_DN3064_c0_g1_i3.p1 TRINITY_DN3064_c0_g1~~TRINITY_DN3064_c0_g1_i3.p1  ORF type:complete len:343 (+),score=83.82 TRINITY_DN3064_c0_g1_i3:88-1116(+)
MRPKIVQLLVDRYCPKGPVIVFCETKKDVNDLNAASDLKVDRRPIHSDVSQDRRERFLEYFRNKSLPCLLATDVAARGIHIDDVELVINLKLPLLHGSQPKQPDVDMYVHRSGRTGRAGKAGRCITLYGFNEEWCVSQLEDSIGNEIQRIGVPQLSSLVPVFANNLITESQTTSKVWREHLCDEMAKSMIEKSSPEEALARVLASSVSDKLNESPSLLGALTDYISVMVVSPKVEISGMADISNLLYNDVPANALNSMRGLTLTADAHGAVFDVPLIFKNAFEASKKFGKTITFPIDLPKLKWTNFSSDDNCQKKGNRYPKNNKKRQNTAGGNKPQKRRRQY